MAHILHFDQASPPARRGGVVLDKKLFKIVSIAIASGVSKLVTTLLIGREPRQKRSAWPEPVSAH